jgi:haloalkane dehalogenase
VWGTQGLNDCPQADFESIDPAAVVAEMGVTIAVPNGPRYWVLDDIVAHELAGSGEIREFAGIEMRSIATVDLGQGVPDRSPYAEVSVERDTEFRFDAGREVYELTAPDGSIYVMQSYSVEIDATLTADALAGLGERLQLPQGWAFAARVLDEPLVVEDIDGVATVTQDELHNSYQLRSRG